MADRLDPNNIFVLGGGEGAADEFVRHDRLIRNGMCPNGCGLLNGTEFGQECEKCKFVCNVLSEVATSQ